MQRERNRTRREWKKNKRKRERKASWFVIHTGWFGWAQKLLLLRIRAHPSIKRHQARLNGNTDCEGWVTRLCLSSTTGEKETAGENERTPDASHYVKPSDRLVAGL
jgi:hypothetical protein